MPKEKSEKSILTVETLVEQFEQCGLFEGQTVLVHSSMSKIGDWVCGGAEAVILALLQVLGDEGTLMMPTHTTDNTEPQNWSSPPVPEAWWEIIRQQMPPFHPNRSRTRQMGVLPETFRTWNGVRRSNHPIGSFAAYGKHAEFLLVDHDLSQMFGDRSPIGKLYELDGYILLLGVSHANNTSLHLAEFRAEFPGKSTIQEGAAMLVNGQRKWIQFEMLDWETDDFETLGEAYEAQNPIQIGLIGQATTRVIRQRHLVDFAVEWMQKNRNFEELIT